MITVKELLHAPEFQHLQLIAGEQGTGRRLNGINIIESNDLISFCRPNELIVTTGVQMKNDFTQLEQLIRHAYSKKVSGFILNVGPYIPEIPKSIVQFANENDFPLFQLEWQYRVADLLKNTIELLSMNQFSSQQDNEQKLLYNLIFRYDHPRMDIGEQLLRRGIPKGAELGIITCTTKNFNHSISQYTDIIYHEFYNRYNTFLSLKQNNELIFLITPQAVKTTSPFSKTAERIYKKALEKNEASELILGMGNFYTDLQNVSKSYDEALTVIHLIKQHQRPFVHKYKEIGAYKIIMNIPDQSTIKAFHQDTLGPLYFYDQLHNTDFVEFLRIFLEENGSINQISKRLFVHRNTVGYKINKVEALLDLDLKNTFALTNLNVAFMIEDILNQQKTNAYD